MVLCPPPVARSCPATGRAPGCNLGKQNLPNLGSQFHPSCMGRASSISRAAPAPACARSRGSAAASAAPALPLPLLMSVSSGSRSRPSLSQPPLPRAPRAIYGSASNPWRHHYLLVTVHGRSALRKSYDVPPWNLPCWLLQLPFSCPVLPPSDTEHRPIPALPAKETLLQVCGWVFSPNCFLWKRKWEMLCSVMLTLTSPAGDSQETDLQGFRNASGHGESASGCLHPHYTTCLGGVQ